MRDDLRNFLRRLGHERGRQRLRQISAPFLPNTTRVTVAGTCAAYEKRPDRPLRAGPSTTLTTIVSPSSDVSTRSTASALWNASPEISTSLWSDKLLQDRAPATSTSRNAHSYLQGDCNTTISRNTDARTVGTGTTQT
jgi:hypothetical protein